jgi:hypothetical protein
MTRISRATGHLLVLLHFRTPPHDLTTERHEPSPGMPHSRSTRNPDEVDLWKVVESPQVCGDDIIGSMSRRYVVGFALLVGLMSGCSEAPEAPYELPDRNAPDVQAEERRLATLLPDRLLWGPGTCNVRLIGREGSSSFAWAECEITPTAEHPPGGLSTPVRVDGEEARKPDDGARNAESVKRLFPRDVADAVLNDPERLRP